MSLAALVAQMTEQGGRFALQGGDGWMQGRTMYGGASSFIAYTAARRRFPGLPPLRAAQVGFVAPVGQSIEVEVTMLRQGRNVAQVATDLYADGALAHRTLWVFGAQREANAEIAANRAEGFVPVDEGTPMPTNVEPGYFVHQLEIRRAEPKGGLREGAIRRWERFRDRSGMSAEAELIAIADALPPGSVRAAKRPGPLSSINWSMTLLGEAQTTRDGWWLVETASNGAAEGFSSETLRLWNADGVEVMRGLQSVAIFG